MSMLLLLLVVLNAALSVAVSLGSKVIPDSKKWKNNLILSFGCFLFLGLVCAGIVTRRDNRVSKEMARHEADSLKADIVSLRDQNQKLIDYSRDCNARVEALTTKFHAPVHFTRGITESLKTQDSVAHK